MPNDMQVVPTTLSGIEVELSTIYTRTETDQWRTAQLFWSARQMINEKYPDQQKIQTRKFDDWVSHNTKYGISSAKNYIKVFARFSEYRPVRDAAKPIPFEPLVTLATKNIDSKTVDKVVKKLTSKNPPTTDQVRTIINQTNPSYQAPPIQYLPDFAERAERKGRFVSKPSFLFGIADNTPAETVRILAKHWKGKYHPDKGGDPDIFNRVVQGEKELLAARGEK